MSPGSFPRVTLPGIAITPEQKALKGRLDAQHEAWRNTGLRMAWALMSTGQKPHVKPPADVIERRRKANKAAGIARRESR